MEIEYELDQWEWQGTTQRIEIDADDYAGLSEQGIKEHIAGVIEQDARDKMHFVYQEDDIVQQIMDELAEGDETE